MSHRRKFRFAGALAMVPCVLLVSGLLAASANTSASGTTNAVLTVSNGASGQFVRNFNPFSPVAEGPTLGFIYEPLLFFDTVDAASVQPWLATSYSWSNGGKTITFDLRHGVKWTDGQPFTSQDVAFTFGLEMKNSQLNTYDLPFKSVTTAGPYVVTINFTQSVYENLIYFGGRTAILPQHLWKSVTTPATFTNPNPIGTGPYELSSSTGEAITLSANPNYYMPGLPKIKTVRFLSFSGNASGDAAILAGDLDWASDFIPNVKKTYVATSPAHHLVEIPTSTLFLACNNEQGPTANLAVREAISSAINRNLINSAVYDGEYLSTNPMGLILPDFQSLLSPSLKSASVSYDPAKAEQILEAAGYKKGSNGIFALNGTPLSVSVQLIAGYTDYVSIAQILVQELAQVGIQLKIEAESSSAFVSAEDNGTFQMAMIGYGFTPNLYAYYYSIYDSKLAPAIGKAATGDYGRFESPQLDSLLTQVAGLPTAAAGKPLFYKMEAIVASQLPYIPVLQNGSSAEFNGNVVRNFPTAANPYAGPDPWMEPDAGWVAMHMTLAS